MASIKDREMYGEENIHARRMWCPKNGWMVMSKAILYDTTLKLVDKIVFMALLDYARKEGGGKVYPSHEALAAKSSTTIKSVQRALKRLRDGMFLRWDSTGRGLIYRIYSPAEREELLKIKDKREKKVCKEDGKARKDA